MDLKTAESILKNEPGYEHQHRQWKNGDKALAAQIEAAYSAAYPGERDLSNYQPRS